MLAPRPVFDGYGSTECGSIATDGVINAGVDVVLRDVPALGYYARDGVGEVVAVDVDVVFSWRQSFLSHRCV